MIHFLTFMAGYIFSIIIGALFSANKNDKNIALREAAKELSDQAINADSIAEAQRLSSIAQRCYSATL